MFLSRSTWFTVLSTVFINSTLASTSVLQINAHGDQFIAPAINAVLGPGHVDVDIFVDTTNTFTLTFADASSAMLTAGPGYIGVASGTTVAHAPYPVAGLSLCGAGPVAELNAYPDLVPNGQLVAWAFGKIGCGSLPPHTEPSTLAATASAPNSSNGGTGPGLEFGFSSGYLGLDTTFDSWIAAELAGLLVSLERQHPSWNPFDLKAALRQTASNWATGYDDTQYGYGIIDYFTATALSGPSSMYLQPPGVVVNNQGYYAVISVMPYRQTRRHHEEVYSVNPAYVWPIKNEYSVADITASGSTLLYTSNGTAMVPTFTYAPAVSGTLNLIAFTVDATGHYSRVESFSKNTITLTIGTACTL